MDALQKRDWMTREEAEAFVGKNASFYMDKWKSHSDTALKGFNWAAAIFGFEWMAYRKMYLEALLYFIIVNVAALFLNGDFWGDCFRLLIGVFGNALYRNKALRTLHKIDIQNESERLEELSHRGGVSPISVVVIIFMELAYGFLIVVCLA